MLYKRIFIIFFLIVFLVDVSRPRPANAVLPQTWLVISTAVHVLAGGAVWLYYNTTKGTKEYHQVQSSQASSTSGYMEVSIVPYKETVPVPPSIYQSYTRSNGAVLDLVYSGLPGNGSIYLVASYDGSQDKLIYASTSSELAAAGWVNVQNNAWCQSCQTSFNSAMDSAAYNAYINTQAYNPANPYSSYMIVGTAGNPPPGYIGGTIEVWMKPANNTSTWEIDYNSGQLIGGIAHVMQATGPTVCSIVTYTIYSIYVFSVGRFGGLVY